MFQNMAASPGLSPGYNNYNSYGGGHGHGHGGHGGHGHSHDDHSGEAGCDIELKYLAVFLVPFKIFYSFYLFVKLREREGQGVDPGRSLKGHLWMVDGGWWISFP